MKTTTRTQDIISDRDALDETVLETDGVIDGESLLPEAQLDEVWNELPDAITQLVPFMSSESEETIAEQLVRVGNEEADLEQREAADELE